MSVLSAPAPPAEAALGFHDRLDAVAEIALAAAGGDTDRARTISKQRWDRQRTFLRRFDLPTAETIRQSLRASWTRVLDVAFAEAGDRAGVLHRLQSETRASDPVPAPGVVLVDDARALRAVAHRLGRSPSEIEYERVARELDDERVRKHDPLPIRLPASNTIREHFESWAAALRAAELPPPRQVSALAGDDPVAVLDEFLDAHDFLPVRAYFRHWAALRGYRLARRFHASSFAAIIEEVRVRRAARGRPTPTATLRIKRSPALRPRVARTPYSDADRLEALRHYAAIYLRPGQSPLAKHYQACSARDSKLMAFHVLTKSGRFQDLCRQAGIA